MAKYANGNRSLAISDRSGQAFPYGEMITEWNGSFVHISEYEPKHPQLGPFRKVVDPQALQDARPQPDNPTSAFLVITTNGITYLGNGNWSTAGTAELPTELENTAALQGAVGTVSVVTP